MLRLLTASLAFAAIFVGAFCITHGEITVRFHSNGFPSQAVLLWRGKKQWQELMWHPSGRLQLRRAYRDGILHGVTESWFADGSLQSHRSYRDGKDDGESWAWHSNGQIATYVKYVDGNEVAYKSWNYFGKPFYNYAWQDGAKVGLKGGAFCKRIGTPKL